MMLGIFVVFYFLMIRPQQKRAKDQQNMISRLASGDEVVTTGGMGALPYRDGLSATGFPSGVRGGPIEIFESMSTVIVWRKQYRQDSGGALKSASQLWWT